MHQPPADPSPSSFLPLPLDTIITGDCVPVLAGLPEKSVDLIFADPPYNLQLQNELMRPNQTRVSAVDDDWDKFASFQEYDDFTRAWLTACRRVLKDDGTLWVIGSYHNIYRVGSILMDLGYWILNDAIWQKTNPMPNFRGTRFTNATETLIWAQKTRGRRYTFNYHAMKHLNDDKQMSNVWHIPVCAGAERIRIAGKKAHSTQKPEALLYRVILASSNPGDVVLDPFFGSGTTGAVARRLKRHYIGIEREPHYVEIARQRIDAVTVPADNAPLLTVSRRNLPRVSFGALVESGYVAVGQVMVDRQRTARAVVNADGTLSAGDLRGSIHKVAAQTLGQSAHNGWDFWYIEDDTGALVSIDRLREQYRADHGLA